MEHSYQGNEFIAAAESLMNQQWMGDRVLYVGDYVDEYYDDSKFKKLFDVLNKEALKGNWYIDYEGKYNATLYDMKFKHVQIDVNKKDRSPHRYIYNFDNKEFIDLKKQPIQWAGYDESTEEVYGNKIHPLSLLLCISNGSGGSYLGACMDDVGRWANNSNSIYFTDNLDEIKEYKELNVWFDENNTKQSNNEILSNVIYRTAERKYRTIDGQEAFIREIRFDNHNLFLDDDDRVSIIESALSKLGKDLELSYPDLGDMDK